MTPSTVAHHKPSPLPRTEEAGTRTPWLAEDRPPIGAEQCMAAITRTAANDAGEQLVAQRIGGQLTLAIADITDLSVAQYRSEFTELLEILVNIASR